MVKQIIKFVPLLLVLYSMINPPFFMDYITPYVPSGLSSFILFAILKKRLKKAIQALAIIFLVVVSQSNISAQPYIDGHKRYSFAQTVVGLDFQYIPSGSIQSGYEGLNGGIESYQSNAMLRPRFTISGLHFWGHADLYVTIPFRNLLSNKKDGVNYSFTTNTETGAKIYPWRIEAGKLRPYVGLSMGMVSFAQRVDGQERGPYINKMRTPLHAGITYNHKNQLFELGLSWYHSNDRQYPVNRSEFASLETAPLTFSLAYKFYFDTSMSAAPQDESGYFDKKTKAMAEQKLLNGLSVGVGISSAFVTAKSPYNQDVRPFLGDYKAADVFIDWGIGYYFFKPDLHFNLAYRNIKSQIKAYGVSQKVQRRSLALEAFKFLGDYHGFVPFVGPVVSLEQFSTSETDLGITVFDEQSTRIAGGIIFGWDIRPTRLQGMILRTNLRYFPRLEIEAGEGQNLRFDNLEFNFIQIVYYPGRAKRINNFKVNM